MSRLQTALHVYVFAALGLFLILVPWSPLWLAATLPYLPTAAGPWLRSGFLRGLISGLGALNVLAAWGEARDLLFAVRGGNGRTPGERKAQQDRGDGDQGPVQDVLLVRRGSWRRNGPRDRAARVMPVRVITSLARNAASEAMRTFKAS